MKRKIILLALSLSSVGMAYANSPVEPEPCKGNSPCKSAIGKKNNIAGQVMHAEKKNPLKDVSVTAYNASKKEKTVFTDLEGGFSFDDLKPGTYRFVFEKAGFKKVTREKTIVKTDENFLLNIEMIEAKDFELLPSPMHFTDF
jgi:hypothetical protein